MSRTLAEREEPQSSGLRQLWNTGLPVFQGPAGNGLPFSAGPAASADRAAATSRDGDRNLLKSAGSQERQPRTVLRAPKSDLRPGCRHRDGHPVGSMRHERQYRYRTASRCADEGNANAQNRENEAMNMQWTAGVDWGRRRYHVCVMDHRGRVVKERAFKHGGKGLPTGCAGSPTSADRASRSTCSTLSSFSIAANEGSYSIGTHRWTTASIDPLRSAARLRGPSAASSVAPDRLQSSRSGFIGGVEIMSRRTAGTPPAAPQTDAAYSVPADPKAEYEILVNEDLGDPLAIGEQRRLFLSQRTSTASASTLREFGLSRRSYSFRVVWCKPQKAATYLGPPEGLTGFDDSIRPDESQIERAREIARSIRIGDVSGNPSFLVPGSSTTVAVNVACSGQG